MSVAGCRRAAGNPNPASLEWIVPADGWTILASADTDGNPENGAQIVIDLLTDAPPGYEIFVSGLSLAEPPLLVDSTGHGIGAATIAAGSVANIAGVITTVGVDVIVDVRAPTVTISTPGGFDADPALAGYQLDLEVITTYAENGQLVHVSSDVAGVVGSAAIAGASGGDLAAVTTIRVTLPPGGQDITANVADASGNTAVSDSVHIAVPFDGQVLAFVSPTSDPVLVNADGYTGNPAIDPRKISVQLRVADPGYADPVSPATVRVRIGCAPDDPDAACNSVYSTQFDTAGYATFTDTIEFYDGELTTMHAIAQHPVTLEVITTPQRTVIVDLSPPSVTISRPGVLPEEVVLSLRDSSASPDWSADGTTIVGPLVFESDGVFGPGSQGLPEPRTRSAFTVRYSDGTILRDGGGDIDGRAIDAEGFQTTTLTGVRYPTMSGSTGGSLEVRVVDQAGNETVASVPIDVDLDPPSSAGLVIDRTPYLAAGGTRSGQADLSWTAATDDSAGGGAVPRYEIRAMGDAGQIRSVHAGGPLVATGNVAWSDITAWESRPLVAEISGGTTTFVLDAIGLDELWTVGIRAFDEADNWSTVSGGQIDTRLSRAAIGSFAAMSTSTTGLVTLGDVNNDGRDDLLVTSGVSGGLLMLGEADPDYPAISGNPFTIAAPAGTGDTSYFGSSAIAAGDINGDGYSDFAIASPGFSGSGNNYVYVYFGGPTDTAQERTDLVTPDSAVVGPSARYFEFVITNRTGRGNIYDITGGDTYDDFVVSANDLTDSDLYVVLGRATWPAVSDPIVLSGTGADACSTGVIKIAGANPPSGSLSTLRFGMTGATALVDDDTYADLVAGASYPGGGTSSAQYVYYGGLLATCPTALDLSDADEILVNGGGSGSMADTQIAARDGEYTVGLTPLDTVEIFAYDTVSSALEILQTAGISSAASDIRFGVSVGFAGDIDQAGGADLVVSGTATPSSLLSGRVYVIGSGDGTPRFGSAPDFWMTTAGATRSFGGFVAADLDYNGDGLPDFAVSDAEADAVTLFW